MMHYVGEARIFLNKEFWARKKIIEVGYARRFEATLAKCTADASRGAWDVSGQREDSSGFCSFLWNIWVVFLVYCSQ